MDSSHQYPASWSAGPRPSLQAPMGLYGVLIVTSSPTLTTATPATIGTPGTAFAGGAINGVTVLPVSYDSDAVLLISEIDAAQNAAVDAAVMNIGTATPFLGETYKWNPKCGAAKTCYPPAVNYAPTYVLLNGQPFDLNNPSANAAQPQILATPSGTLANTGNVMLRVVNAGLRTHVPSLVGLPMQQIAEDGNRAPGSPQTVSELLMTAGKTRDVLVTPPTTGSAPSLAFTEGAYGFFDRSLGLSTNGHPNGGAQGYFAIVSASTLATAGGFNAWLGTSAGKSATVIPMAILDTFAVPSYVMTYTGNVLTNDIGIYSAAVSSAPKHGTVTMSPDGTFVYTSTAAKFSGDTFMYCGNGATAVTTSSLCTTVTLTVGGGPDSVTAANDSYNSRVATVFRAWAGEGVLANDTDTAGYPVTASAPTSVSPAGCVTLNPDGSFVATSTGGVNCSFNYTATDSQGQKSAPASVTVNFAAPTGLVSGLAVTVQDALGLKQGALASDISLTDYMWVIEEDPTFHTTPGVTPAPVNGNPALTISNSFHVSHTTIVAAGCTGPLSCGDAQAYSATALAPGQKAPRSLPKDVYLDPAKHYFISVLPGDAGSAFIAGLGTDPTTGNCTFSNSSTTGKNLCGHTIGGAQIANACTPPAGATTCPGTFAPVTVLVDPNPLKPSQLSVIAFEDNNPVNGDLDDGETGLGGWSVIVFDAAGRSGDPAGQITYDAFNMPLTNWLLGKPGCPNEENPKVQKDPTLSDPANGGANSLVGVVYTCPDGHRNISGITVVAASAGPRVPAHVLVTTATPHRFTQGTAVDFSGVVGSALFNGTFTVTRVVDALNFWVAAPAGVAAGPVAVTKGASARDSATYSLAGHALIKNIMPGRFDVLMHPSAAREGAGENWIQVSTLEGTPANDAFARAGEPAYFQEFGPPGYHAFVGWMNPDRVQTVNTLLGNGNSVSGRVTNIHMSRPSQIFNFDSTTRDPLKQTVCYVGLNTTGGNGATAGFAQCDDQGNFTLNNVPYGSHQIVVWDQWLDQIIAYFNVDVPAPMPPSTATQNINLGDVPVLSWFTLVQENAFVYDNSNCATAAIGPPGKAQADITSQLAACTKSPLAQIPITIRFRDGSISNLLQTDSNGNATFNELFPLFNWYVAEVDQTRYAPLTAHVVVDGGGKPDCTTYNSTTGGSTPTPGCTSLNGFMNPGVVNSTYPTGETTEHTYTNGELYFGLQGFISQTDRIDWGKTALPNDGVTNGGFSGVVVYTSTRGFDDPHLEVQFKWEPLIPRVPVHLYQKVPAPDGTTSLKLVAVTTTTSWDDVAAGLNGNDPVRNPLGLAKPVCPGQVGGTITTTNPVADPYVPQVLGSDTSRCYDGFHNWNQVQPLTYDGYYQFPAMYPSGANLDGTPVVQGEAAVPIVNGQYVIEIVPPPGYEVVKEEDKNILIGDAWVTPPAQQFAALSNIFIQPDQAAISSAYNLNGPGSLQNLLDFVDGSPQLPLCAGSLHRVPDFLSLFPNSKQVAPFAGADRPLCDRKQVQIMAGQNGTANFFVYSNTPRASKFAGIILDDASAEFNVAAPDFGEKFGVPYVAVSIRDQYGIEIERMYGDQWGGYNGMTPSTWQVNVPNPAGYSPNMLVTCMNDPGPITVNGVTVIDPQYMPTYSNFCYTNPFMPGLTTYLDTPVLPLGAFASNYVSGYNPVDCAYPDATPAISRVDGDGTGPWLSGTGSGHVLTIKALGTVSVPNAAYLGPNSADTGIKGNSGSKTVQRTYSFGTTPGTVSIGGKVIPAGNVIWGDLVIKATVPSNSGFATGELGITTANGTSSVDTVTVTIESKKPTVLTAPSNSVTAGGASHVVQAAIDAAQPGDLIILNAGVYNELVVMWKPVRLQGVGAASVIINAAKYPTDKLEAWRPTINTLFGVDTVSGNASSNPQVDPLPGQEITGGIVFLEPSVLATEEGAGITVLAKDRANGPNNGACTSTAVSNYYDSAQVVTVGGVQQGTLVNSARKISDSYFDCPNRPSRIDGITVTGGDAGGGIYVNGYAHGLEISNNRVYGNAGAFGGGIRVGVPHLETQDLVSIDQGYDNNVNIHHNSITQNGLIEASGAVGGTPGASGAGAGLSLCTGTNNYQANYNFVCGNYSSSDGGGIGHIGWSKGGRIAHNTVLFNQSFFQQSATNGGGIIVEGEAPAAGGLSLGSGPGVTVDSNLVQGNFAQGGHGGGIALTQVNGSDATCTKSKKGVVQCSYQNSVSVINNMIVDNVAGWSAGGLYLQDALNVSVFNNTVAMNDSVGIAGPLFTNGSNHGTPNPAGIAADANSPALAGLGFGTLAYSLPQSLTNNILWHNRSFYANLSGTRNPPNNVGFQGTAGPYYSAAQLCVSNSTTAITAANCVAAPYQITSTPTALSTIATGQCGTTSQEAYWDLGVVGDTTPTSGATKLSPTYSVLTSTTGYGGANNTAADPALVKSYCNSSQAISASSDEQGNFVDFRYGPLTQTAPVGVTIPGTAAGGLFGSYGIQGTSSSAYNAGSAAGAPGYDFFGTKRPQANLFDIGAMEYKGSAATQGTVSFSSATGATLNGAGTALNFGTKSGTVQSAVTVSVSSGSVTFGADSVTNTGGNNAFSKGADTCTGTTVNAGSTCTVVVNFTAPRGGQTRNGSLSLTDNGTGSPQTLSLTGN